MSELEKRRQAVAFGLRTDVPNATDAVIKYLALAPHAPRLRRTHTRTTAVRSIMAELGESEPVASAFLDRIEILWNLDDRSASVLSEAPAIRSLDQSVAGTFAKNLAYLWVRYDRAIYQPLHESRVEDLQAIATREDEVIDAMSDLLELLDDRVDPQLGILAIADATSGSRGPFQAEFERVVRNVVASALDEAFGTTNDPEARFDALCSSIEGSMTRAAAVRAAGGRSSS